MRPGRFRFPALRAVALVACAISGLAACGGPAAPPPRSAPPSPPAHHGVGPGTSTVEQVRPIVEREAARRGLPEDLVFGVIYVESRFNPEAVSPVGARGLMQLMPGTARYLARMLDRSRYDLFDPAFNIEAGCLLLNRLLQEWSGDETLALAAYNAGSLNVKRWLRSRGDVPDEVAGYSRAVEAARLRFRAGAPPAAAEEEIDREGLSRLIRRKNEEALHRAERDDLAKLLQSLDAARFQQYRPDSVEETAPPSP